ARENGIVHDQVLDWLTVLASLYRCKLLHTSSCCIRSNRSEPKSICAHGQQLTPHRRPPACCRASAALCLQGAGHGIKFDDPHCISAFDGSLGHTEDHA